MLFDADRPAHIDFETRSTIDLKKAGPWVYFEHPSTDVWCCCYAFGDEPVQSWVRGDPLPEDLAEHIRAGRPLIAHVAMEFERIACRLLMGPRYGWPVPEDRQWHCSAAQAAAMALPRGLAQAAAVMSAAAPQKDMAGNLLMRKMMRPRAVISRGDEIKCETCKRKGVVGAPRRKTPCLECAGRGFTVADADKTLWWDEPELLQRLVLYCVQDVEAERGLHARCRPLSDIEREIFLLDAKANTRGITVDCATVRRAQAIVKDHLAGLNRELYVLTRGAVGAVSQVARLTEWLGQQGLAVGSLDKYSVRELLACPMPPTIRRVVEIRAEGSKSSTAKLQSLLDHVSADGRMRGNLLIYGASTGRWAGKGAQLHNLPRPGNIKDIDGKRLNVQGAIGLLSSPECDAALLDVLYGPPLAVVSECLRGMLMGAPGCELVVADFNAIEARVNAWLSGEAGLLELFQTGGDPYRAMAGLIYQRPVAEITKEGPERQLGKKVVLGAGYQMSWERFRDTCLEEEIVIDDDLAKLAIKTYRATNQRIVGFWYALNDAALNAVDHPGKIFSAGAEDRIRFVVRGAFLWMRLPSGRMLAYARPHTVWRDIQFTDELSGELRTSRRRTVAYWGVDSVTRQWTRAYGYGGHWCENACQAVARDFMAEAMLRVEAAGYPVLLTVHDEIITEVAAGFGDVRAFERLMCLPPDWGRDCPIKAEGWRGIRYRK